MQPCAAIWAGGCSRTRSARSACAPRASRAALAPRTTAPYQTEELAPMVTSPDTEALGATKASPSSTGRLPATARSVWCFETERHSTVRDTAGRVGSSLRSHPRSSPGTARAAQRVTVVVGLASTRSGARAERRGAPTRSTPGSALDLRVSRGKPPCSPRPAASRLCPSCRTALPSPFQNAISMPVFTASDNTQLGRPRPTGLQAHRAAGLLARGDCYLYRKAGERLRTGLQPFAA